jgi:hypothetical protein
MGAFLSKGEFSGKWLKKKPPLAGEVSRIGTEGSLYLGGTGRGPRNGFPPTRE